MRHTHVSNTQTINLTWKGSLRQISIAGSPDESEVRKSTWGPSGKQVNVATWSVSSKVESFVLTITAEESLYEQWRPHSNQCVMSFQELSFCVLRFHAIGSSAQSGPPAFHMSKSFCNEKYIGQDLLLKRKGILLGQSSKSIQYCSAIP